MTKKSVQKKNVLMLNSPRLIAERQIQDKDWQIQDKDYALSELTAKLVRLLIEKMGGK